MLILLDCVETFVVESEVSEGVGDVSSPVVERFFGEALPCFVVESLVFS